MPSKQDKKINKANKEQNILLEKMLEELEDIKKLLKSIETTLFK